MRHSLAAVILAVASLAALPAAANSAHFTLVSPADLAVIPQGATSVTLTFQIDWAGLKAQYGSGAKVGLSMFFRCCYNGIPLGGPVSEGETSKTFTVAAIQQAMSAHAVPADAAISWTLDLHFVPQQSERAESRFFLRPPHRPGPRLTPSLVPDNRAWPSKIVVTNDGDAGSEAAILTVKSTVVGAESPVVRAHCRPALADFTRDLPALRPGAKAEFATGAFPLVRPPVATKAPSKSPPAPGPAKPVVTTIPCTFGLSVAVGPALGSRIGNPTGVYGSLTRTLHTIAPVN